MRIVIFTKLTDESMLLDRDRWLLNYRNEKIRCCSCGKFLMRSDDGNFNQARNRIETSFCQKCIDNSLSMVDFFN